MKFIKNIDNKLLKRFAIIIGSIVVLFIILIIFTIIKNGRLNYNQIENRMIQSAKNYYKNNESELPQNDGGVVSISTDKLVEKKYLKDLSKLVKNKNDVCSGIVTVTNNDGLLLYSSTLSCSNYETKKLKDVIASNVVTSGNGVYQFGDSYIFKGDNVNNYINFANKTWRILRVNGDGSIRIIDTSKRDSSEWDNRYNSDKKYNTGINDFTVSRIYDSLNKIYEEFPNESKAYIIKQNLCIGKRSENDTINDGSIECANTLPNQNLGLIQVNEYALASNSNLCIRPIDPECSNYNYIANMNSMWTLNADSESTHKVFKISGTALLTSASNSSKVVPVVHINSQVNYISGDGTFDNPYKFN